MNSDNRYWDSIADEWKNTKPQKLWRKFCDLIHRDLLTTWLTGPKGVRLLKTDLFDEAVGDGSTLELNAYATVVFGMDISHTIVRAARSTTENLTPVNSDIRDIPFKNNLFDILVSLSTVDHFKTEQDIFTCLKEFYRVLDKNGRLVITIDNPKNPCVALRNGLSFDFLCRHGLVPYFVGRTLRPSQMDSLIKKAGFKILDARAIVHCPRFLAVQAARFIEKNLSSRASENFLKTASAFERLAHLPSSNITGHYYAVLAIK